MKIKIESKIWGMGLCCAGLLAALPVQANLVVDGNFNSPSLSPWTISPGGGGITSSIGTNTQAGVSPSSPAGIVAGDSNYNVAYLLGGAGGAPNGSTLNQSSIALAKGVTYILTFLALVAPTEPSITGDTSQAYNSDGVLLADQLTVKLDGSTLATISPSGLVTSAGFGYGYDTYTYDFTPTANISSATLSLNWISSDASGTGIEQQNLYIDNVSLNAVPEPATVFAGVSMLLPFGVSALRILRKSKKA